MAESTSQHIVRSFFESFNEQPMTLPLENPNVTLEIDDGYDDDGAPLTDTLTANQMLKHCTERNGKYFLKINPDEKEMKRIKIIMGMIYAKPKENGGTQYKCSSDLLFVSWQHVLGIGKIPINSTAK